MVTAYKEIWDNADNQEYKFQMCSRDERGKCGWQIQKDEDEELTLYYLVVKNSLLTLYGQFW